MQNIEDFNDFLAKRITQLRTTKGVSARDMSLTLGQGAGYINSIENKNSLPSMHVFYFICDFFKISPQDFFDADASDPKMLSEILGDLKTLTPEQLSNISGIVKGLRK